MISLCWSLLINFDKGFYISSISDLYSISIWYQNGKRQSSVLNFVDSWKQIEHNCFVVGVSDHGKGTAKNEKVTMANHNSYQKTKGWFAICFIEVRRCKTHCQLKLCKRLAGPIIPLSWSCLVCKRVSHMDVITGGQSTTIFRVLGHFRHGDKPSNKQTTMWS